MSENIKVVCRIRPANGEESCIIACSKGVIASASPLSKFFLEQEVSGRKLNWLKAQLMQEGTILKFDDVAPEDTSQSQLFKNWIQSPVTNLFTGRSAAIIAFGTSGAGKSFTMRGGEGQKRGLILRAVESILSLNSRQRKPFGVHITGVGVVDENTHHLIRVHSSISEIEDLHAALHEALRNRKLLVKEGKDKVHFIVSIKLYQKEELVSQIQFAELAGSQLTHKPIARAFNTISNILTQTSPNWEDTAIGRQMGRVLNIYNSSNPSQVVLVCCVNPKLSFYSDTLAALKFTSRIRECVGETRLKAQIERMEESLQKEKERHASQLQALQSSLKHENRVFSQIQNSSVLQSSEKETVHLREELKAKSTQNSRLSQELEESSLQNAQLKGQVAGLNHKLQSLQESKLQTTAELEETKQKLEFAHEKITFYQNKTEEYKASLNRMKEDTQKLKQEADHKYQSILQELSQLHTQKQEPEEDLKVDMVISHLRRSSIIDAQELLNSLSSQINSLTCQSYSSQTNDLTLRVEQTQKETLQEIENIKTQLTEPQENHQLEAECKILREQLKVTNEEKEKTIEHINSVHNSQINSLLGKMKELSDKLQEEQCLREEAISKVKELNSKSSSESLKITELPQEQLAAKVQELSQSVQMLTQERDQLIERTEKLLKQNTDKEEQIQELFSSNSNLENEVLKITSFISDYESLIYELRKCLSEASAEAKQARQEKAQLESANSRLHTQVSELKTKLGEERSQSDQRILEYMQESNKSNAENQTNSAKLEDLQFQLSQLKLENDRLTIENNSLKSEADQLKTPFDGIEKRIDSVRSIIADLEELSNRELL